MNIRGRKREGAELSVESLNDIMFFLLLFFLIVSTLANPNIIKLMLPSSKQSEQTSKKPINLSVTNDLKYYIEKEPIAYEEIEPRLRKYVANVPDLTVVIRIDNRLEVQQLVNVLQIGVSLKVKMVLATERSK
ncbi:MAG: biopolymer transporter ExbD [Saprospiraceae bacterium]|uniref:Biopolymer transporter ExbD n=1 Tax=Candidatus Defluviibacterium haderslevense TaxID=2981993 RepID=A0A9D7SAF5_9BACT|nr:biopolymer transporter ExbD [Candidatus Defluviibacterium haderslevense]MBK9718085.1 biopolymer transporter ExbD [Candidatus Defluviibacterium haderslevense]MBL0237066.1 biopolymer transporter ExbD [Candidatus Defluviibacterium haderslevense]HRI34598.1 biopolymer transporter ExbD [Saprospiraceae bacterium]